jgi:hypothetical protein
MEIALLSWTISRHISTRPIKLAHSDLIEFNYEKKKENEHFKPKLLIG